MRTLQQLRNDFALYIEEIERCENAKCYWALLHVLLALPDVCASLEADPAAASTKVGDRYVDWYVNLNKLGAGRQPTGLGIDRGSTLVGLERVRKKTIGTIHR